MRSKGTLKMAARPSSRLKILLNFKPTSALYMLFSSENNYTFIKRIFSTLSRYTSSPLKEKVHPENERNSSPPVRGEFVNRNPRNVEYEGRNKPRGYGTQFSRRDYYNKLNLIISNRHIKAYVQHYSGTVLMSSSTTEFPITRQLYKTTDTAAAANIGRVLAQRCLEAGFTRVFWEPRWVDKHKLRVKAFTKAIQKGGLTLNEPKAIIPLQDFYSDFRPKKAKKKWKRMPNSEKRKYI